MALIFKTHFGEGPFVLLVMTQDEAYEHLLGPENCFLTGSAGSGKSFLINRLIEDIGQHIKLAVTATTGIAARNIQGSTLHSWLGIGLGRRRDPETGRLEDFEDFWRKCEYSPYFNKTGISTCDCLIIDEVSMMQGYFIQDLQQILKRTRKNNYPFGHLKVIFVGDFLQLPPVTRATVYDWAFKSKAWREGGIRVLNLDKSYRQTDPEWIAALNDLRVARLSRPTIDLLESRRVADYPEAFRGTFLMTHNEQVANYNLERLNALRGEPVEFRAICTGKEAKLAQLKATLTTPEFLQIKRGARVIATVNDREGRFYNGSIGQVADWDMVQDTIDVRFEESEEVTTVERFTFSDENRNLEGRKPTATFKQFPIKLAWALSIHASQGQTLSEVFVDASHIFVAHQLYVALSRCKTLSGLSIRGFDPKKCYVDYDAQRFYEALQMPSPSSV